MSKYLEMKKKAILMGSNVFWLPSGYSQDKVVAAYRFKGVSSAEVARQDLSGNGRNLEVVSQTYDGNTYTPSWSSANGYYFAPVYGGLSGYLNNAAVNSSVIRSAVVCYSGVTQGNRAYLITAGGGGDVNVTAGRVQIFAATTAYVCDGWSDYQPFNARVENYGGPGYAVASSGDGFVGTIAYHGSTYKASGVIGANFDYPTAMFIDGELVSESYTPQNKTWTNAGSTGWQTFGNSHDNISDLNNAVHSEKTIIAAAFFAERLSPEQHAEIATMMLGM